MRERVAQDRLPLLSLLEAEPLRMRSSHLSFQEYFTVRAICTGKYRLPRGSPPWRWGPFWANVVKLGLENERGFAKGLLCAAGVASSISRAQSLKLNLSRRLGGDRPTVLAVLGALLRSRLLRVLDLSFNELGPEGGAAVAKALEDNDSLTLLRLDNNRIGAEGAMAIAQALKVNGSLKSLKLRNNDIGDQGGKAVAKALHINSSLTSLRIGSNDLGPEGGAAFAEALKINGSLTHIE